LEPDAVAIRRAAEPNQSVRCTSRKIVSIASVPVGFAGTRQATASLRNRSGGKLPGSLPLKIQGGMGCKDRYCVEEADESVFWLEMLSDCEIVPMPKLEPLLSEARELSALFTASQKTARLHR
jgi:hypothetical protein